MLDKTYRPAEVETRIYAAWDESGAFRPRPGGAPYCIMMPPPNVTGSLHMGHALTFTIQDTLVRFHRMLGRETLWQPGTDHAGIATQMVVERELAKAGSNVGPARARPRGVRRQGLGVEGALRRHDRAPAPPPRRLGRLVARALHHGRRACRRPCCERS